MEPDSRAILDCIDRISVVLGYRDFADFRAALSAGTVLLSNLAECTAAVAALPDDDVKKLVDNIPEANRSEVRGLLTELEGYAPMIKAMIEGMKSIAQSRIGRPPALSDRESVREVCKMVLGHVGKGCTEAEAKRRVASKLNLSPQTIHRAWKQRATAMTHLSAPELLNRLLMGLQTVSPKQANESTLKGMPDPYDSENNG